MQEEQFEKFKVVKELFEMHVTINTRNYKQFGD